MKFIEYDRKSAIEYAKKWAYKRNSKYYNFDSVGGDCTNFISQCLYEGSKVMNYKKDLGWYYINGNNKSPSWTGVEFLFDFLVNNKIEGPFGKEVNQENIQFGDVVQISFDEVKLNVVSKLLAIVYDENELFMRSLSTDQSYYFCIEAFNENGVSKTSEIIFCK